MNHSLVSEIRALAQNLEHWENLISEASSTANLDSV